MTQQDLAQTFRELHVKGDPVILYNAWDPGSAIAVAESGAKAIAQGSHGVANAFGFEDGEDMPLDLALGNARRIVENTDLPVTMDIETGYGKTPEEVKETARQVIATGVIGVNLEDQIFDTKDLKPIAKQVERIQAIRQAADEAGVPLHINARSDIFKNADPSQHATVMAEALERAQAYKDAGGDSFFAPGLKDIELIRQFCEQAPLPVNIVRLPDMVSNRELAEAGVARISYGPGPYLQMIEWLKENARKVYEA